MKKQTAVEWLYQEITKKSVNDQSHNVLSILNQAKEMEKQQIIFHSTELCKIFISNPIKACGKTPQELVDNYFKTFKQ